MLNLCLLVSWVCRKLRRPEVWCACLALLVTACGFKARGNPACEVDCIDARGLDGDGNVIDGDAAIDAPPDALPPCPAGQGRADSGMCQPLPHLACSLETDVGTGIDYDVYTLTGYLSAGLDGSASSGLQPLTIQYGSEVDTAAVEGMPACDTIPERYEIPNPLGCNKPEVPVTGIVEPVAQDAVALKVRKGRVNYVMLAQLYSATPPVVRNFDLTANDGDPAGLIVSGSGSGFSCMIVFKNNRWVIKFRD